MVVRKIVQPESWWLACLAILGVINSPFAAGADASSDNTLQEVVVTAQKKQENLLDVPVPVAVVSAESLVATNQVTLADYYSSVPGLNYTPGIPNGGAFTIRGLNSGGGSATVATLIDGVPFGTISAISQAAAIPDLDPAELERIEVLRGPQGVLYGASGLGGTVNYVTKEPSTEKFGGQIQADLNTVKNGDSPGYGERAALNIPLSDTLAVRVSEFARRDAGYITNIETGQTAINSNDVSGGRLAALWKPSDKFSIDLSGLVQNQTNHGDPGEFIGYNLEQSELRGTGVGHTNNQFYSLIVNGKVGPTNITSVTSYSDNFFTNKIDTTPYYSSYTPNNFEIDSYEIYKSTEELRLNTSFSHFADWLVGGYFSHEDSPQLQYIMATDPNGVVIAPGELANYSWWSTWDEYAAFTDLTVHFTDSFDLQIGGRESTYRQHYNEVDSGPLIPIFEGVPSPAIYPKEHTDQNAFTFLFTPSYKFSPDMMLYSRIASGYRPGGPNFNDDGVLAKEVPTEYQADRTINYELGFKGAALDQRLSIDASLYYIDWKNIQVQIIDPITQVLYFGNAGRAKSEGIEVTVDARPAKGTDVAAWVSLNNAVLTQAFPASQFLYAVAGDRLPYAAKLTGNLSIQQDFALSSNVTGFAGGALSYVGDRLGLFVGPPPGGGSRTYYPAYAKLDLHLGVRYDNWVFSLFANNVTDRRGVLSGGPPGANEYYLIRPRSAGISAALHF